METRLFLIVLLFRLLHAEDTQNKSNKNASNTAVPNRGLPVSASISRLLLNSQIANGQPLPRIQYESYKALAGETVRLECPQPNPTWFFRRALTSSQDKAGAGEFEDANKNKEGAEDLIVTRHGVINADYKYKIMCHVTLKHKVIVINNVDFEDEGLYTCLYTLSTPDASESEGKHGVAPSLLSPYAAYNNEHVLNPDGSPVQYRYVFNVSVYSTY
jgi:hypothetical protein